MSSNNDAEDSKLKSGATNDITEMVVGQLYLIIYVLEKDRPVAYLFVILNQIVKGRNLLVVGFDMCNISSYMEREEEDLIKRDNIEARCLQK